MMAMGWPWPPRLRLGRFLQQGAQKGAALGHGIENLRCPHSRGIFQKI